MDLLHRDAHRKGAEAAAHNQLAARLYAWRLPATVRERCMGGARQEESTCRLCNGSRQTPGFGLCLACLAGTAFLPFSSRAVMTFKLSRWDSRPGAALDCCGPGRRCSWPKARSHVCSLPRRFGPPKQSKSEAAEAEADEGGIAAWQPTRDDAHQQNFFLQQKNTFIIEAPRLQLQRPPRSRRASAGAVALVALLAALVSSHCFHAAALP